MFKYAEFPIKNLRESWQFLKKMFFGFGRPPLPLRISGRGTGCRTRILLSDWDAERTGKRQ